MTPEETKKLRQEIARDIRAAQRKLGRKSSNLYRDLYVRDIRQVDSNEWVRLKLVEVISTGHKFVWIGKVSKSLWGTDNIKQAVAFPAWFREDKVSELLSSLGALYGLDVIVNIDFGADNIWFDNKEDENNG